MIIKGNTVGTTMPRSDWNQTNPLKADFIKNKPDVSLNGIGAAPAGFGLGNTATYPPDNTLNKALANGWYWTGPDPDAHPATPGMEYAVAFTKNRSAGGVVQELTSLSYDTTGCQMNRITLDGGANWIEEWVNPPLVPGTVYRTTERRNGKAVYKELDTNGILKYRLDGEDTWQEYTALGGYGLGTTAVALPEDNLNKALRNGWYWATKESCAAAGLQDEMEYAVVLVKNRFDGVVVQELTSIGTASGFSSTVGCQLVRYTADGGNTWINEWVNPPMKHGVEYRTTKRYLNSQPVYVKLVAYDLPSAISANSNIAVPHGISGLNTLVSVYGRVGDYIIPYLNKDGASIGASSVSSSTLILGVHGMTVESGKKVRIIMEYTK